jgi:hypothetical protein
MSDRENKEKQRIMDFRNAFMSEGGVRVLADLRKKARSDFVVTPLDHNNRVDICQVMLYNGQRSMITYIDSMLEKDPNVSRQKEARS